MSAFMTGDFSKYPEPVRDVLPYLVGEVCNLRVSWQVYKHLFISSEERTREYAARLAGILGAYQFHLQDTIMAGLSRLLDTDQARQKNLTFWALHDRIQTWDSTLADDLKCKLDSLSLHCADIRIHRNKRIAHLDLPVSLGAVQLPSVELSRLREAIERMEAALNLVSQRTANTTTMFTALDHRDTTTAAEITILKAIAYDEAVKSGKIEDLQWRKHIYR